MPVFRFTSGAGWIGLIRPRFVDRRKPYPFGGDAAYRNGAAPMSGAFRGDPDTQTTFDFAMNVKRLLNTAHHQTFSRKFGRR